MNKPWHDKNKMPKGATAEQKIKWHLAHARNCGCRPIPNGVVASIKAREAAGR